MSAAVAAVAGAPVGRPEYATDSNDTAGVLRVAKSYLSTTRHEVALRIRMGQRGGRGGGRGAAMFAGVVRSGSDSLCPFYQVRGAK